MEPQTELNRWPFGRCLHVLEQDIRVGYERGVCDQDRFACSDICAGIEDVGHTYSADISG